MNGDLYILTYVNRAILTTPFGDEEILNYGNCAWYKVTPETRIDGDVTKSFYCPGSVIRIDELIVCVELDCELYEWQTITYD